MMMKACRPAALVLALLSGCVAPATGNGGGGEGGAGGKADGTGSSTDATLSASWEITDVATNTAAACPQGYDTVAITAQQIDHDGDAVGQPTVDLYECSDNMGDVTLEAGRYRVSLAITSHDGAATYASSTSTVVDLGASDKSAHFSIARDGGYFSVAWNLIGATTNNPLKCSDVQNLDGIELVATLSSSTDLTSDIWDCADGSGLTSVLRAGTYTVSMDALNDTNGALGTAPAIANSEIYPLNKVTSLGTVTIPIDGK